MSQKLKKLHPEGLDAVFDSQGGDDCARGVSLLAPWGTYLLFGNANIVTGESRGLLSLAKSWWTQVEKVSPMKLFEENKIVGGLHLRQMLRSCPTRVEKALGNVWDLMAKGDIHPLQDETYHFEQVTQAMQRMHERKNIGRIMIVPEIFVAPPPVEEATPATEATNGNKDGENSSTTNSTAK